MPSIGICQPKNDTSAIIRSVREERTGFIVTYRGEPVAEISPLDDKSDELVGGIISNSELQAWQDALVAEIDAARQSEKSVVELLSDQRH